MATDKTFQGARRQRALAVLLYHVMNKAGGYEALRQGIASFRRNELLVEIALSAKS